VAAFLTAAIQDGRLRRADPTIAALHYFALLGAELYEPVALGVREQASDSEISAIVDRAVDVFLTAYGAGATGRP
ncbi:TetR/AcrR family transcriptional regulator C-terminal domain-containing protein, partial [Streptomyces galilaeus]|uniref:TetR/AcrR family transcriptional regulator C-terminal domain-containing protein n=1 Tax=Streptomyces galilaeus TaxID=33899 RepID=UPI0038F76762